MVYLSNNMDTSQSYYAEWKKLEKNENIQDISTYIRLQKTHASCTYSECICASLGMWRDRWITNSQ